MREKAIVGYVYDGAIGGEFGVPGDAELIGRELGQIAI